MNANTAVDSPSAVPSDSVAIATNPGERRSERNVRAIDSRFRMVGSVRAGRVSVDQYSCGRPRRCQARSRIRGPTGLPIVYIGAMSRLALFLLVIVAVFFGAYSLGTRRARNAAHSTPGQPGAPAVVERPAGAAAAAAQANAEQGAANTAAREGVPVGPYGVRVRSILTLPDQRLATYLRSAYVAMMASYADMGQWPTDPTKLPMDRPANSELRIVSASNYGVRLSAIDNKTHRQCDLFTGDSAKMAFGYAYDPSMPACGKVRSAPWHVSATRGIIEASRA